MKIIQSNFLTRNLLLAALALGASPAFAQVSISVDIAPPPLQVYTQPACPDDGDIWTPGYWAYSNNGYVWVPGAWVQPPQVGDLWTPPYWGWEGNTYAFYPGYWGPDVGYYGGVNYGYGYGGRGYRGGRWEGGHFSYNTAVNNVSSTNFHHTYVDRSVVNSNSSHVSYNGGAGGVQAQPTAKERQARHIQPVSAQQVAPAKSTNDISPNPVTRTETPVPSPGQDTHPADNHETTVKPPDKTGAIPQNQNHPAQPANNSQSHPAPPANTQSHSEPPANNQSHSEPAGDTQSHPEAPAKPEGPNAH